MHPNDPNGFREDSGHYLHKLKAFYIILHYKGIINGHELSQTLLLE